MKIKGPRKMNKPCRIFHNWTNWGDPYKNRFQQDKSNQFTRFRFCGLCGVTQTQLVLQDYNEYMETGEE